VCCSVLQCVAVCWICAIYIWKHKTPRLSAGWGVLQHAAEGGTECVAECVAVCGSVLHCDALCCSVLQCEKRCCSVLQRLALYCSVL